MQTLPIWRATSAACELTPPFRRQNSFRGNHAAQIFRASFRCARAALFRPSPLRRGAICIQVNPARSRAGTGGQTARDRFCFLHFGDIKDRREKLVQLIGRIAHHRCLPVDEFLLQHVHRELERGGSGPFAVARLEHEKLAVLDGELEILHVLEMFLERGADLEQFRVALRHQLL